MRSVEARRTRGAPVGNRSTDLSLVRENARTRRNKKQRVRRYIEPVGDETRRFDPMFDRSRRGGRTALVGYGIAALLFHAAMFYGLVRQRETPRELDLSRRPERVSVEIQETPPKPVETPAPEPETDIAPAPAPTRIVSPPAARERARSKRVATLPLQPAASDLPADPVNVPDDAPAASEPRRRVVGINFESTVRSGDGPAFAVGNTRMGATGRVANRADAVTPLPGQALGPGAERPKENRISVAIPTTDVTIVKPKRLEASEPAYPELLKTQGIEGNVTVLIRIDANGAVINAEVVKGSGYPAFDAAAKAAALEARFAPARRNGEPIAYTLKYTYRFRVKDQ